MKLIGFISTIIVCASSVFGETRTSAPAGAVVVSKNGANGSYKTIQAAVDSLSKTAVTAQYIWIDQGTYNEQVYIANRRAPLTIYGYTTDTSDYKNNKVTITWRSALATGAKTDDETAALRVWTSGFYLYNVNVENTFGQAATNGQALAISANQDQQAYYGVSMKGYQDTLLANAGRQFYGKCLIQGATDFIFGQHAQAWIDSTDIRIVGPGYVTASGRAADSDVSIYVINKSNIAAAATTTAKTGQAYLGRPWGDYARVCVQNTFMTDIINPAGWRSWKSDGVPPGHASFFEYGNGGAGASGQRATFSKKISAPYTVAQVLGSDYTKWVDSRYLS